MINKFFYKLAVNLANHGNIQEKYIALYAKAMEVLLAIGINLVTALMIGYFLEMWWYCIIFLVMFIPLRSYAGGYHARGYTSCYMESCALLITALLWLKYFILERRMISAIWQLFLLSAVIIFILAPLADENKPISEKEAKVFKRRARITLIIEGILAGILIYFSVDYCYAIMMAVIISAFALVLHQSKIFLLHCLQAVD